MIGTLARRAEAAGYQVIISTGDKDMSQLVNDAITIVNTMTGSRLDRAGVKAKFDVWPEQIVDYLALVGDASDNIPGRSQGGTKDRGQVAGSIPERGRHHRTCPRNRGQGRARICARAWRLWRCRASSPRCDCNVELPLGLDDLTPQPVDSAALQELYTRYELRSLLRQLTGGGGTAAAAGPAAPQPAAPAAGPDSGPLPTPPPRQYETVVSWEALEVWLARLRSAPLFAFDTETTSLDYMIAEIVGVSFCVEPGIAAYVPLAHDYAGAPEQLPRERVLAALKPLLEDPNLPKLGQHLKYDAHVLANHGIQLQGMRYDTMLESYVWNSVATRHDMDSTAARYLGIQTIKFEQVAGKGAKQLTFNQVPVERAAEYSAEDADVTLQLHQVLSAKLRTLPALERLYTNVEQPLVPVLLRMEHCGVLIDGELLSVQSRQIETQLRELLGQAQREAGAEFNIESPKQLQQILFEKLQIPVLRKTPTGQPSTAEDVLEELAETHALPRIVLDYRTLAKLKSTYTDKLPQQINARTGRVHTSYHQAVAQTGRLSSTDPNLQNIPIRRTEGRRIRQAFIAPPGSGTAGGRLLADRTAHHGAPVRGSGSAGGLRRGSRRACGHRRRSVRRRNRGGDLRPAPHRQDHQLRTYLWHVALWSGAPAGHRSGFRAGLRQPLFRALSGRAAVHGQHPRAGAPRWLRGDRMRSPALPAGYPLQQPPDAAVLGTQRHQCPDAGHRRGHHQAGHDQRGCLVRARAATGAADHAGAR